MKEKEVNVDEAVGKDADQNGLSSNVQKETEVKIQESPPPGSSLEEKQTGNDQDAVTHEVVHR